MFKAPYFNSRMALHVNFFSIYSTLVLILILMSIIISCFTHLRLRFSNKLQQYLSSLGVCYHEQNLFHFMLLCLMVKRPDFIYSMLTVTKHCSRSPEGLHGSEYSFMVQDCQKTGNGRKEGFGRFVAACVFLPSKSSGSCSTTVCYNTSRSVMPWWNCLPRNLSQLIVSVPLC